MEYNNEFLKDHKTEIMAVQDSMDALSGNGK